MKPTCGGERPGTTSGGAVDVTCYEALGNAARNLTNAETISDLALMERLTAIANAWTDLASLLAEREKV